MIEVSFFDKATGLFDGNHFSTTDEDSIARNTPEGRASILGHHDPLSRRVDIATGLVVDYQPPQPSPDYDWNADSKRWQFSPAAQGALDRRRAALAGIGALEAKGIRAMRELALNAPGAADRLKSIDDQIATLRGDL